MGKEYFPFLQLQAFHYR